MGYLLAILFALGLIGTGAGYWHGLDVGEQRYAAKLEVAQQKVQEQAKQLVDEAVQHQADVVAAFDKGRADVQEKTKIVYVKGAQYAANDKALSSPQCVMADASLLLLNNSRADLSAAAAAVAALGLSEHVANNGPVVRSPVPAEPAGRSAVPGVSAKPAGLHGPDEIPGVGLSLHRKP